MRIRLQKYQRMNRLDQAKPEICGQHADRQHDFDIDIKLTWEK